MPLIDTHLLVVREPKPGWHGRFFHSESMTFAYYALDAGASLHEHSHPNEETWHVLSGELEITIGGDTHHAGAGVAAIVPSDTAHSVRAIEASRVIVADHGVRADVGGGVRAALSIELGQPADGAVPLEIRNQGGTEGVVREVVTQSGFEPSLPPPIRTMIPAGDLPGREALASGASMHRTHPHPPLTDAEREAIREGRGVFHVRGVILYEDARGERHHTTFCRVYDPAKGFVRPQRPGYNYGD